LLLDDSFFFKNRRCVFKEYKEWLGENIDDEVLAIPAEIIQNELDT